MIKLGITGLIGSGKSTLSNIIKVFGYPIYNADYEAKYLMNSNITIINALKDRYGENIYINNSLNKELLSQIIFNKEDERIFVNSIVHPIVILDFISWCENQNKELVFIESAILFEAKIDKLVDKIIVVRANKDVIVNRIISRDNISKEEAEKKINIQEKSLKTSTIDNNNVLFVDNNEKDTLLLQCLNIIDKLKG